MLIIAFVPWALRPKNIHPLVELRLLKNRNMTVAVIAMMLFAIAFFGASLLFPLYFQEVRGETALGAGLLLAPQGIGAMLTMPIAGFLADKIGPGKIVLTGISVVTIGMGDVHPDRAPTRGYLYIIGALFIMGLGMGGTMMPIMSAALATLSDHNIARGSTFLNINQQVAASIGTALFSVLLTNGFKDSPSIRLDGAADGPRGPAGEAVRAAGQGRALAAGPRGAARPGPGRHGRRVQHRLHRGHDPGGLLPDPGVLPAAQEGGAGRRPRRDGRSLTDASTGG